MACGGALYDWSGPVTVSNSLLSGNSTSGATAFGGAVYSRNGAMTVINSTLTGNSTSGASAVGGAIDTFAGPVTVTNSTIAQNHATHAEGGGIAAQTSAAIVTVRHTILSQNTDHGTAPDLYSAPGASVTITSSLIGNNQGTGLTTAPVGMPDANGNLIGTAGAPIDPILGTLAFNGGPTQTLAVLPGSPAIDAGRKPLTSAHRKTPLMTDHAAVMLNRSSGILTIGNNAVAPLELPNLTTLVGLDGPLQEINGSRPNGNFFLSKGQVRTGFDFNPLSIFSM
jgi:hypothetical protein